MKLVVAISGASGVELGFDFLKYLPDDIETHLVISENAVKVAKHENGRIIEHDDSDIAASVASGSFGADATAIIPCSMNTLAKIACGISDNLTTRVAAVALKERKKLLIAPREMPFSTISLENMYKLSLSGAIIAPPIPAYYSECETLEDIHRFLVGKWFDLLGIDNELYRRWEGKR